MQFHHHGYVSGEPRVQDAAGSGIDRPADLPDEMDVLIVGSGPAGMLLSAQMSQFPDVTTRIIERRDGRLVLGQADGIQPRSVETFQAFGFAERIVAEAYNIAYMNFWGPDPQNPRNIIRTARTEDYAFKISEFPHLIVNQARVLDYFAEAAAHGPGRIVPDYGVEFLGLTVHDDGEYPVEVRVRHTRGSSRGRGAHSAGEVRRRVRRRAQRRARGDRTPASRRRIRRTRGASWTCWSTPTSPTGAPNARSTPRRATSCTSRARAGTSAACTSTWARSPQDDNHHVRQTPIEEIIRRANDILHPYSIDVKQVAWHSVYEVGPPRHRQVRRRGRRRRSRPARLPHRRRVPHAQREGRAGNERVDAGRVQPRLEARTRAERTQPRVAAVDLLGRAPARGAAAHRLRPRVVVADGAQAGGDLRPAGPRQLLPRDRRVPLGVHDAVRPPRPSSAMPRTRSWRPGFPIGKRFKSVEVVRVCDGNAVHLGHHAKADGRWRVYAFADAPTAGEPSSL